MFHGDELPPSRRNTRTPGAELPETALTPPEGGWPVWYLTDEDDVGESTEQGIIVRLLLAALAELARERGWARSLVAGDQFFAWVEAHPLVRISPDVYVLDDPPPRPYPASWQTWRGHSPPRFAVEVVSEEWKKDYEDGPRKYAQLGARELVIFDPDAVHHPRGPRVALQVYRRGADDSWTRVAAGAGPVHSVEIDAWLVVVPGPHLRIARDAAGADLVQTPEEQLLALRRELRHNNPDSELRRENHELGRQMDELRRQLADLRLENAQLRRENAQLGLGNAHISRENAELHHEIGELRRENAELRRENSEFRARIAAQADRIAAQTDRIHGLESTVHAQAATILTLESTVADQAATILALESTVRDQAATIAALESTVAEQAATIRDQAATIATLESTVAAQAATIRDQAATILALEAKVTGLEAKVAALEATVASLLARLG